MRMSALALCGEGCAVEPGQHRLQLGRRYHIRPWHARGLSEVAVYVLHTYSETPDQVHGGMQ